MPSFDDPPAKKGRAEVRMPSFDDPPAKKGRARPDLGPDHPPDRIRIG